MTLRTLEYTKGVDDPKEVILAALKGHLDKVETLYGSRVLVATAPAMTKIGSIYTTDKSKDESRFQGKAGLLLRVGPTAFKYDPRYPSYEWEGSCPLVGNWVYYWNSSLREIGIGGVSCRIGYDSDIIGVVSDPEAIY